MSVQLWYVFSSNPFGKGVAIFIGKTDSTLCPVSAILNYLTVCPAGSGPLFVLPTGATLSRGMFVKKVRAALEEANLDYERYSGHSFRIGAATSAAMAGIPAHVIKMLGRWESEAYQLYIRTPRETLASISRTLAN